MKLVSGQFVDFLLTPALANQVQILLVGGLEHPAIGEFDCVKSVVEFCRLKSLHFFIWGPVRVYVTDVKQIPEWTKHNVSQPLNPMANIALDPQEYGPTKGDLFAAATAVEAGFPLSTFANKYNIPFSDASSL